MTGQLGYTNVVVEPRGSVHSSVRIPGPDFPFSRNAISLIKVLLVDDDPDLLAQADAAMASLSGEFLCVTAGNGEEALEMVEKDPPDIVISDISMPHMDGLTLCRKLKRNIFFNRIPIILLTARANVDDRINGFEAGADDYLVKPIDFRELAARIRAILRRYKMIMDLNPSTRLPGADAVEETIQKRIKKKENFSICYLDLDNFKAYADTYGFEFANKAIKLTARIIGDSLKPLKIRDSFLAHVGGDDFIVVSPIRQAMKICKAAVKDFDARIIKCFKDEDVRNGYYEGFDRDGNFRKIPLMSISVVILVDAGNTYQSAREIGEQASRAKRLAKRVPGSNIVTVKPGMLTPSTDLIEEDDEVLTYADDTYAGDVAADGNLDVSGSFDLDEPAARTVSAKGAPVKRVSEKIAPDKKSNSKKPRMTSGDSGKKDRTVRKK